MLILTMNELTVFQVVKLLPNEIERFIYEFLPTVEQYRQEFIFAKYNFPMCKDMEKRDSVTVTYTSNIRDSLNRKYPTGYFENGIWSTGYCFIVPNGTINDEPIMERYQKIFKKWAFIQTSDYIKKWFIPSDVNNPDIHLKILPIFSRKNQLFNYPNDKWTKTFRNYKEREFEMMRDAILVNKYRTECNKRNNIKRRQYRAEWRAFPPTHKARKIRMKNWTDAQIHIDYLYANYVCYKCTRKWLKNKEGQWIMQKNKDNAEIFNNDDRGKIFTQVLTCVETGHTQELKSDPRTCNECAKSQLLKQMKCAAYYF